MNLVLLPGMDGTGELFSGFTKSLPKEFNAQTISYPTSHFLSYEGLTSYLGSTIDTSQPFVIVAESFSTPLAIQYAAIAPSLLKGLVLCAGFALSPIPRWLSPLGSVLAPLLSKTPPESLIRYLLAGPNPSSSLISAVRSAISRVQPGVLSARFRAIVECDARPQLKQLTLPILYLQAAQDRLIRSSSLKEIQRVAPHVKVASLPGPHLLLQREPEKASMLITKFAQQLEEAVH
jgi:pimeloyl-ACP methyl ester carboxylesterase